MNIENIDIENEYRNNINILGNYVFAVKNHPKSQIKSSWFIL